MGATRRRCNPIPKRPTPLGPAGAIRLGVFAGLLREEDARRATVTVKAILAHGFRCALTGGLAIAAHLRARGRTVEPQCLNDIDLVVQGFDAIPESVTASFLLHHVHPDAFEGRTLLQLIDEATGVRVDLFRTFGNTLTRASAAFDDEASALHILSIEDLVARTTALVCGSLRRRKTIDRKHVTAFTRLLGLGRHDQLVAAWSDHRQAIPGTLEDARREATRLLKAHPELVVVERYSAVVVPCERCREEGLFRPGPADRIVQTLGYW